MSRYTFIVYEHIINLLKRYNINIHFIRGMRIMKLESTIKINNDNLKYLTFNSAYNTVDDYYNQNYYNTAITDKYACFDEQNKTILWDNIPKKIHKLIHKNIKNTIYMYKKQVNLFNQFVNKSNILYIKIKNNMFTDISQYTKYDWFLNYCYNAYNQDYYDVYIKLPFNIDSTLLAKLATDKSKYDSNIIDLIN